ncbi:MAG: TerB family tellurite resistance protein [Gammaproteobacteria bacterium]|nr:TerB family tellurite resistance protein [Gammaproteobacteria bacterium]
MERVEIMLARIKTVMKSLTQTSQAEALSPDALKMAAVVLMVEVMMADHQIEEAEKQQLLRSSMEFLAISREEGLELIEQAIQRHDDVVSLYALTKVINERLDSERKIELIAHMWRVAYSDRQWDKYEEHLIRKVADLLYISHKDFIHARVLVEEQLPDTR